MTVLFLFVAPEQLAEIIGAMREIDAGRPLFVKIAPDLSKDPFYRWLSGYHWVPLTLVGLGLLAWGGWGMVIWAIFLRVTLGLHATWMINSATHIFGSRRFDIDDDSRNVWWVALLTFGEGWHNNHHAHPVSARHGLAWYEFDMNWIGISILKMLGLAWDIKVAKIRVAFGKPVSALDSIDSGRWNTHNLVDGFDSRHALHGGYVNDTAALNAEITRQASMVAYIDDFWMMFLMTLAIIPLLGVPLSFYNALMPAWMSERFAAYGQGRVMGLLTTVFCLSNTLIALVGGVVARLYGPPTAASLSHVLTSLDWSEKPCPVIACCTS